MNDIYTCVRSDSMGEACSPLLNAEQLQMATMCTTAAGEPSFTEDGLVVFFLPGTCLIWC